MVLSTKYFAVVFIAIVMGLSLFSLVDAKATIPVEQAALDKANRYLNHGIFIGGHFHDNAIWTNLREGYDASKKTDRIVLDFSTKRPPFFSVDVKKSLVLRLEGVGQEPRTLKDIAGHLRRSHFFGQPTVYGDRASRDVRPLLKHADAVVLKIPLKQKVRIEAFELSNRLVIDAQAL